MAGEQVTSVRKLCAGSHRTMVQVGTPGLEEPPKGAVTIARATVEPAESAADGSDGIASSVALTEPP